MKRRKLVGITLIVAAILLQVGYATTIGQIDTTVRTKEFKVDFEKSVIMANDASIEVESKVEPGKVDIVVSNLYPGGKFDVVSTARNKGEYDAEITDVELIEGQGEGLSSELFRSLVGYIDNQTVEDYNNYLKSTYMGRIVKIGEAIDIPLHMGMSIEETGLENETVEFKLVLQFEQVETDSGGGTNPGQGGDNNGDTDKVEPSKKPEIPKDQVIEPGMPEETQLEALQPEEPILTPNLDENSNPIPTPETTTQEVSKRDILPKTGGVTPIIIYGLGIILLGSGIAIYKKKEE